MQIEGFVVVDIKEVFDVKTKAFKKAELQESFNRKAAGSDLLGFMRIRCLSRGHSVFSHNLFTRSESAHVPYPQSLTLAQEELAMGCPAFLPRSTAVGEFEADPLFLS